MAVIMKVVIEEYINHIAPYEFKFVTDPKSFTDEKWYRENWMAVEFTLVYRWHSALPETLTYEGSTMPMTESLWNNALLTKRGLGALFEETSGQSATRIGLFNTAEFLIEAAELPSIALGRMAQLKSYNDYRELCRFPRVTRFEQITGDPDACRELERLYGNVDNVEFYVGLKPYDEWTGDINTKQKLIDAIQKKLEVFPGVIFNYTQPAEDAVEEAETGLKSALAV